MGEVATGLAHEIKNPLAGLSGALEILSEDFPGPPSHCETIEEMRRQVSRLASHDGGPARLRAAKARSRPT